MSVVKFIADGETLIDGTISDWEQQSAEDFVAALVRSGNQKPGLLAVARSATLIGSLAEVIAQEQDYSFELTNSERGWTLTLEELT